MNSQPLIRAYTVYVDGACAHACASRGRGGYGYVIVDGKVVHTNSGAVTRKTSNQMELVAVIASLKGLSRIAEDGGVATSYVAVSIISDSKYVVDNWQNRLVHWLANGWKTKKSRDVANAQYWKLFLELAKEFAFITISWTKGHAGNKFQNLADKLAREACGKNSMPSE